MITLEDIKNNAEIKALINGAGNVLEAMNYTEHGLRHVGYVSHTAGMILQKLGYDERTQELARIAGYVHDVGNLVNRLNHGITAAILIYPVLRDMGMPLEEVCTICSAIGNHEEEIGYVVNSVSAALIIADKSDAHRTRVQRMALRNNDIHDVVNYSIKKNIVLVDGNNRIISAKFYMDNTSSVMDYLTIFLTRIKMSQRAATFLNCTFRLYINDVIINTPKKISSKAMAEIIEGENEEKHS